MYENMSGPVGFAMHEDRLARAAKNMRINEALAARKSQRIGTWGQTYREMVAKALLALATRLAPTTATTQTTIHA